MIGNNVLKLPYVVALTLFSVLFFSILNAQNKVTQTIPENDTDNINPDLHLKLLFNDTPVLGTSGKIRIYDYDTDKLIDSLDLSIPSGPTDPNRVKAPYIENPFLYDSARHTNANTKPGFSKAGAVPVPGNYQLTIIGGFTEGFHFYPVIIREKTATIYLHHSLLEYNKRYYVTVDEEVFGIDYFDDKQKWNFTTKINGPDEKLKRFSVAADGSGDFNTVQGAIDFVPDFSENTHYIFIKNGIYEEIVYFRNKRNVIIKGESRSGVKVCYSNNEVFNPHPLNIATNEWPGTFPSRRAAFMVDNCKGIVLNNFTIESINPEPAQAEGLLVMGEENSILNMTIIGSGDALQVNGSVYVKNTSVTGIGDNILGRGPTFFKNCELISTGGPHMWIRNTEANHGNVFVDCTFATIGDTETVIARSPLNKGRGYPYAESVLINCKLEGVAPMGWGPVEGDTTNVRFWEYNSTNLSDGKPVDVSKRHPVVKQLSLPQDKDIIDNYSNPVYILGEWVKAFLHSTK